MKRLFLFLIWILTWGLGAARAQEAPDSTALVTSGTAAGAVSAAPEATDASAAPAGPTPDQLWDLGNTAYVNGDYHTASEYYEAIRTLGLRSVKLYYTLGNAYFKEGRPR